MSGILDGKVALITGAGSGIGQGTSRIFAREGAKLVLADVVEEGGNRTLKMVQDLGAEAIFVRCDVSQWNDAASMLSQCASNPRGQANELKVAAHQFQPAVRSELFVTELDRKLSLDC